MITLIKYEYAYTAKLWLILAVLLFAFTGFAISDYQILSGPEFEIDYWGGLYSIFLYAVFFYEWVQKYKEKRIRIYRLLPLPEAAIAKSRFYYYLIPMVSIVLYLVVIHFIIIGRWEKETASFIGQTGLFFGWLAIALVGRDSWIINQQKPNSFKIAIIILAIAIFIVIIAMLITILPHLYNLFGQSMAGAIFFYSKVLFYIGAFIILSLTLITYKKRKSYLE